MNDELYQNSTEEVRSIARALRKRFIELKQQYLKLPKPYKLGERHNNMDFFAKTASMCIELQANPADFMKACFEMCGNAAALQPNMLYGKRAPVWWKLYCQTYKEMVELELPAPEGGEAVFVDKHGKKKVNVFEVDRVVANMTADQWTLVESILGRKPAADDEETIGIFLDYTIPLDPWFRIFVYPNNADIWREYSYPGKKFLQVNPDVRAHLMSINPIAVQIIDQRPSAPKPGWLQFDDTYDG